MRKDPDSKVDKLALVVQQDSEHLSSLAEEENELETLAEQIGEIKQNATEEKQGYIVKAGEIGEELAYVAGEIDSLNTNVTELLNKNTELNEEEDVLNVEIKSLEESLNDNIREIQNESLQARNAMVRKIKEVSAHAGHYLIQIDSSEPSTAKTYALLSIERELLPGLIEQAKNDLRIYEDLIREQAAGIPARNAIYDEMRTNLGKYDLRIQADHVEADIDPVLQTEHDRYNTLIEAYQAILDNTEKFVSLIEKTELPSMINDDIDIRSRIAANQGKIEEYRESRAEYIGQKEGYETELREMKESSRLQKDERRTRIKLLLEALVDAEEVNENKDSSPAPDNQYEGSASEPEQYQDSETTPDQPTAVAKPPYDNQPADEVVEEKADGKTVQPDVIDTIPPDQAVARLDSETPDEVSQLYSEEEKKRQEEEERKKQEQDGSDIHQWADEVDRELEEVDDQADTARVNVAPIKNVGEKPEDDFGELWGNDESFEKVMDDKPEAKERPASPPPPS